MNAFLSGTTTLLIYVDDSILCGPSAGEIQLILVELAAIVDVTDERLTHVSWESR
jgi:hypothetical protein